MGFGHMSEMCVPHPSQVADEVVGYNSLDLREKLGAEDKPSPF